MVQSFHIHITGKVQGVFFRQSTRQEALRLGISGFVRNESDGSVFIEAVGESEAMQAFVQWCHRGSAHARVKTVQIRENEPHTTFDGFEIRP